MVKFKFPTTSGAVTLHDSNPSKKRCRTIFYCKAKHFQRGLPHPGNPRQPNTKIKTCEDIRRSFRNKNNDVFEYMHRGLTIMAESVKVDNNLVTVEVSDDPAKKGGLIDGRHTESLLFDENMLDEDPERIFLVQVLHGIRRSLDRVDIAVALNSQTALTKVSALNAHGVFDSLKKALEGTDILDRVQFEQNGDGEKEASVSHLINLMFTMRLDLFPGNIWESRGKHPNYVVTATKQGIREDYPSKVEYYEKLFPVLPQICTLYDLIEGASHSIYKSRKQAPKAFRQKRGKRVVKTTWRGWETTGITLPRDAILPLISAFRLLLKEGTDGKYQWRIPFYPNVINLYHRQINSWVDRLIKYGGFKASSNGSNQVLMTQINDYAKNRDTWGSAYGLIQDGYDKFSSDLGRRPSKEIFGKYPILL
jgi:hypothetical protein